MERKTMPSNRTTIRRERVQRFTVKALKAFAEIRQLAAKCTCAKPIYFVEEMSSPAGSKTSVVTRRPRCPACERILALDGILFDELQLAPWDIGCSVEAPDSTNPYPVGCIQHERWAPNADAVERWLALDAALPRLVTSEESNDA
jgi:hypothetical protein